MFPPSHEKQDCEELMSGGLLVPSMYPRPESQLYVPVAVAAPSKECRWHEPVQLLELGALGARNMVQQSVQVVAGGGPESTGGGPASVPLPLVPPEPELPAEPEEPPVPDDPPDPAEPLVPDVPPVPAPPPDPDVPPAPAAPLEPPVPSLPPFGPVNAPLPPKGPPSGVPPPHAAAISPTRSAQEPERVTRRMAWAP